MKKIIWVIVILFVAAAAYLVYPKNSQEQAKPNPLEYTEKVRRGDLVITVSAVGTVEPEQAVDVKSKASGQIMTIYVDDGDRVKTGDLICILDKTTALNDYRQAEADSKVAEVTLRQSVKELQRQKELFESHLISEADYDNALLQKESANSQLIRAEAILSSAKERLDDTVIKSPIDGVILKRYVDDGQIIASGISSVSGGTSIVRVAVMDTVYIEVDVDETDIGKTDIGQRCSVEADAFPGEKFSGKIIKISPLGEMQQNITYFKITTAVDNSSGLLKAGMNATCEITAGEAFNVLIVPREAVTEEKSERTKQTSEDSGSPQKIAFTIRDGKPTPTPVEVGISNYESTEIKSGLSEGDEILVRAKSMVMADRAEFRNRMKRWNSLPGVKKDVGK